MKVVVQVLAPKIPDTVKAKSSAFIAEIPVMISGALFPKARRVTPATEGDRRSFLDKKFRLGMKKLSTVVESKEKRSIIQMR